MVGVVGFEPTTFRFRNGSADQAALHPAERQVGQLYGRGALVNMGEDIEEEVDKSNRALVHFVGFKDERYWAAVKVWGRPDFYHRLWDVRATREIVVGDVVVFCNGDERDVPSVYSWDASQADVEAIEI